MSIGIGIGIGIIEAACQGGLSLAAIRARLVEAGAMELFLPSTYATTAFQSYRIYPSAPAIGYPVGLLCGVLSPYAETETLINREFDNSGAGWTKVNNPVFSGSSLLVTGGAWGIKQGEVLPWRLYRLSMTVTQALTTGYAQLKFANSTASISSFGGVEFAFTASTGGFSAHIVPDATNSYGPFFGTRGGTVAGTLILTNPSCKLIGGGLVCRQATDGNRPSLRYDGRVYYISHTSGQKLTAYVPSSLGATCTIVYASPGVGAQALYNVPVTSNAVDLVVNHSGLAILPSNATAEQVAVAMAIMGQLAWRTAV